MPRLIRIYVCIWDFIYSTGKGVKVMEMWTFLEHVTSLTGYLYMYNANLTRMYVTTVLVVMLINLSLHLYNVIVNYFLAILIEKYHVFVWKTIILYMKTIIIYMKNLLFQRISMWVGIYRLFSFMPYGLDLAWWMFYILYWHTCNILLYSHIFHKFLNQYNALMHFIRWFPRFSLRTFIFCSNTKQVLSTLF